MLGQFADVADVFLSGGGPVIFYLDELLELRDTTAFGEAGARELIY